MTYEEYRYVFIGAAILCIVMLIVSVILFIVLRIPKVIGDLSGATARKAINYIREQNEKTGEKAYKSSAVNIERGRLTDKISQSGRLIKRGNSSGLGMLTEKISTQPLSDETTVLDNGISDETTVLSVRGREEMIFEIEFDITYIHTDEIIINS